MQILFLNIHSNVFIIIGIKFQQENPLHYPIPIMSYTLLILVLINWRYIIYATNVYDVKYKLNTNIYFKVKK